MKQLNKNLIFLVILFELDKNKYFASRDFFEHLKSI